MDEVVEVLQELLSEVREINRILNGELNWLNEVSLGKQLMNRLDAIESVVQDLTRPGLS
ncbi:hypothetical protein [Subtercola endophyticus]|uniref:hypothetical protein n=1 Tax=Subtercola endophyticus TaxID=2895559 RepID=UPI001E3ED5C4|nr:hypothetical protein [Subtercola endophyticus]UFS57634.1 hypothetical protein LQ955_11235 [Subtercola endophyticus]